MLVNLVPEFLACVAAPDPVAAPGGTVKVLGALTPLACALACVTCAVYWPGASAAACVDQVVPLRGADRLCTGAPAGRAPL